MILLKKKKVYLKRDKHAIKTNTLFLLLKRKNLLKQIITNNSVSGVGTKSLLKSLFKLTLLPTATITSP